MKFSSIARSLLQVLKFRRWNAPEEAPARLIVGLGNPGRQFRGTPHNLGFEVIDSMVAAWGCSRPKRDCRAVTVWARAGGRQLLLAKPLTYMNRSGDSVAPLLSRYRLTAAELIVVCDDLALPFGKLRVRPRGSAGGHRGVQSIIEALGTDEFVRVRLGIGRTDLGEDAARYVLAPLPPEQRETARVLTNLGQEAVSILLNSGVDDAMRRFN